VDGNLMAERSVELAKKLLEPLGYSEARAAIYFMSSAEAEKFRGAMHAFGKNISELGPNPSRLSHGE